LQLGGPLGFAIHWGALLWQRRLGGRAVAAALTLRCAADGNLGDWASSFFFWFFASLILGDWIVYGVGSLLAHWPFIS